MVRIPLLRDAFGTEGGEAIIDGDNITIRYDNTRMTVSLAYLDEVSMLEKKELGKVKARIVIYSVIGSKSVIEPMMSEQNFFLLKGFMKKR